MFSKPRAIFSTLLLIGLSGCGGTVTEPAQEAERGLTAMNICSPPDGSTACGSNPVKEWPATCTHSATWEYYCVAANGTWCKTYNCDNNPNGVWGTYQASCDQLLYQKGCF